MLSFHPPVANSFQLFARAQKIIHQTLPAAEIHHVGSTAVSELGGKGIIDILIALPNWQAKARAVSALRSLGYTHVHPEENKRIFLSRIARTGVGDIHLHLTYVGSREYKSLLFFLHLLRSRPALVREYALQKKKFLRRARGDRKLYSRFKSVWIQQVISSP